ncbi:MAG: DUF2520 domain-containing protein [Tannerella sp.]|jgi:predicted short-subunit dehydrogenase-like oxidoreductase (DUF2520 family)|nr:DUF2520 domain-containing protein [Tannerella sp.]
MKVVFIGSGNVATHLSVAMQKAGYAIGQVYSRSEANARRLAGRLHCDRTARMGEIISDAELYVFAVKDDALPEVIAQMPANNGLWIHTAGSVPMDVFKGYAARYGVLYPLQTFSKNRDTDFRRVPCLIEACLPEDETRLQEIAGRLSDQVQRLSSGKREWVHLAAVFACNFSNHMYALAGKLVREQGLSTDLLLPLTDETAAKLHTLSPAEAQTGPAVRGDRHILDRHLALLSDPPMREIYQLISNHIYTETKNEQHSL